MRLSCFVSLAAYAAFVSAGTCQSKSGPLSDGAVSNVSVPILHKTVDLKVGKIIAGIPLLDATVAPMHCSNDGFTYLDGYNDPARQKTSDFYSISPNGDAKHITRVLPSTYARSLVRDVFIGDHSIVTLLASSEKTSLAGANDKNQAFFLSLSDSDGDNGSLINLDLPFEPFKVAQLESGRFLLLSVDTSNGLPNLSVLNGDGSIFRTIDLDKWGLAADVKKSYGKPQDSLNVQVSLLSRAINSASFVPFGSKVLLSQPGSKLPIVVLSDIGFERTIPLDIPEGFFLQYVIASGAGRTILVRTQSASDFQRYVAKGMIENPEQQLLEIDSETGRAKRLLDATGARPADITCASDGKLTAIYFKLPDAASTGSESAPVAPDTYRLFLANAPK